MWSHNPQKYQSGGYDQMVKFSEHEEKLLQCQLSSWALGTLHHATWKKYLPTILLAAQSLFIAHFLDLMMLSVKVKEQGSGTCDHDEGGSAWETE